MLCKGVAEEGVEQEHHDKEVDEKPYLEIGIVQNDAPSPTLFRGRIEVDGEAVLIAGSTPVLVVLSFDSLNILDDDRVQSLLDSYPQFEQRMATYEDHVLKIDDQKLAESFLLIIENFDLCKPKGGKLVSGGDLAYARTAKFPEEALGNDRGWSYILTDKERKKEHLTEALCKQAGTLHVQDFLISENLMHEKFKEESLEQWKETVNNLAEEIRGSARFQEKAVEE